MLQERRKVKCTLVGNHGVGKTCLTISSTSGCFPGDYIPTLHENYTYRATVNHGTEQLELEVEFYDTAGHDDYDRIRIHSYPGTEVFLVCFSIVDPSSFEAVKAKWHPEITLHCPNVPFLLVGLKLDLVNDERTLECLAERKQAPVQSCQGQEFAKEINAAKYIECSALTHKGIKAFLQDTAEIAVLPQEAIEETQKCLLM